jgi:tRNA(Ile)-lysidine synthase TilS/MesJ
MSHGAVLVSGGPDSAVLLHDLYARGERPLAIHLNLGELESPADAPRAAAQAPPSCAPR